MIGIQQNINNIPILNPKIIDRPSDQEEPMEENHFQNVENINGQDYITQVTYQK